MPVRFDTYAGCGHACSYCFVSRKTDISNIANGESLESLRSFIAGKRTAETNWCDWNIPLHWGGVSDPFQPIERHRQRSLEALKIFAETKYPFVVSTKSALIAEEPYLSLLRQCNCVVQFSACSPKYDAIERGAATYEARISAAAKVARYCRVNIRIQPYIPAIFNDVIKALPRYADLGFHGVIVEGMKYTKPKVEGLCRIGGDFCYPVETLLPQFIAIRSACHNNHLKFYCGENRLRSLSDELCCCGVEGMGWTLNEANLNHHLFDPAGMKFTPAMKVPGSASVWGAIEQNTLAAIRNKTLSYADKMVEYSKTPYSFQRGGVEINEKRAARLREYMQEQLKKSGKTRKQVDQHLGTNGMAGHYFGASQWTFPTREAYAKLRQIIPTLGDYDYVLEEIGGVKGWNLASRVFGSIR